MDLTEVSFSGPPFEENSPVLQALPHNLVALLRQINGFIQFRGGLHVRGLCAEPTWHALEAVMRGERALFRHYPAIRETDVPFGQDCVADQFLLREGIVHKLQAETGALESLGLNLPGFFSAAEADPVGFLAMQPLLQFEREGGSLGPGNVLHVYPPFCTEESGKGVSLRAVGVEEALAFLATFSRQLSGLATGDRVHVKIVPS
jgi:hypothetical protein